MSLAASRQAICDALDTTGVRVYQREPEGIQPPCWVIGNPSFTYDDDFDGGVTYSFPVALLVSRSPGSDSAIEDCEAYIDPHSSTSIRSVLLTVPQARPVSAGQFNGDYVVGDISFVGVTFTVEVFD